MKIGGLKTIVVKVGQEQSLERLFKELREIMLTKEPDCQFYSLLKSRTNPQAYIVQEKYPNQKALDLHESSTYGAEYFPKMRSILDVITVEYFDVIVD